MWAHGETRKGGEEEGKSEEEGWKMRELDQQREGVKGAKEMETVKEGMMEDNEECGHGGC